MGESRIIIALRAGEIANVHRQRACVCVCVHVCIGGVLHAASHLI